MSLKNGDRARAHKIRTKRRLRRMQIRTFRRILEPGPKETHSEATNPVPASEGDK